MLSKIFLSILAIISPVAMATANLSYVERDIWVNQLVDSKVMTYTIGNGPEYSLQWQDPITFIFGPQDKINGLKKEDAYLFQMHGQNPEHDFLTNFCMFEIIVDGRSYKSTEHYYQAVKFPIDSPIYIEIVNAPTPIETKRIAYRDPELASLGDDQEMGARMKRALWGKFVGLDGKPTVMGILLLATGEEILIEGNKRPTCSDRRWGAEIDLGKMPQGVTLQGQNLLGKLLMELRAILRDAEKRA